MRRVTLGKNGGAGKRAARISGGGSRMAELLDRDPNPARVRCIVQILGAADMPFAEIHCEAGLTVMVWIKTRITATCQWARKRVVRPTSLLAEPV